MAQDGRQPVDVEGHQLTNIRLGILAVMAIVAVVYVVYIAGQSTTSPVVAGLPTWYWSTFAAGAVLYILLYLFVRAGEGSPW